MITITGATGQLGSLIVENLLEKTEAGNLAILTRSPAKAGALAEKGVVVHKGNYDDSEALVQAFRGSDVLMFVSNSDVSAAQGAA